MKLPDWIKIRRQRVTETHVHLTISADEKALAEMMARELRLRCRRGEM